MKLALVCPTVGQTQRGYERMFTDLLATLNNHVDVMLFTGADAGLEHQVIIRHFKRHWWAGRRMPGRLKQLCYHMELWSFARAVLLELNTGGFDLVHVIDPPLARYLGRGRRRTGAGWRLLYTDAGPWPDIRDPWVDHSQCINPAALEAYRRAGVAEERVTMLPVGIDPDRLTIPDDRAAIRRRLDLPADAFVILDIASINRHHKRLDHLIEEVAAVDRPCLLWIDGSLHPDGDPSLVDLAAARLGDRCRITHLPSNEIAELYHAADLFVHAATVESYGIAIIEAMRCGLPVLLHDSDHFRWLAGENGMFVDMQAPGALAKAIDGLIGQPAQMVRPDRRRVAENCDWPSLGLRYLDLYRRVLAGHRLPAEPPILPNRPSR